MRGSATSPRRFFVPGGRCGEYLRRRADARLQSALQLSIRTTDRSLKEVERLKAQGRRLARRCLDFRDRLKVAKSIIGSIEMGANGSLVELQATKREARHLQEENEHLRADASELMQRVREFQRSIDADSQSVLETNWQLVSDLRAANHEVIRQQERCRRLVRELRPARRRLRALDRLVAYYDGLPLHRLAWNELRFLARTASKGARRTLLPVLHLIQWIFLAPIFGRRGATEVQEALHHG